MATATFNSDYTPLRYIHGGRRGSKATPQIAYSKVASKPTLHHAHSWSSNHIAGSDTASDYTSYTSLGRTGSSCSADYGAMSRASYDTYSYCTPSSTQSDCGTSQRRDYEYVSGGRTKSVRRKCTCSKYTLCYSCKSRNSSDSHGQRTDGNRLVRNNQPAVARTLGHVFEGLDHTSPYSVSLGGELAKLQEDDVYDTLTNNYRLGLAPTQTVRKGDGTPSSLLGYSSSSADYYHHGNAGSAGMLPSGQSQDIDGLSHRLLGDGISRTSDNYLHMRSRPSVDMAYESYPRTVIDAVVDYGDDVAAPSSARLISRRASDNLYASVSVHGSNTPGGAKSVKFSIDHSPHKSSRAPHSANTPSVKREWNKLRNLLTAVSAVKRDTKSKLTDVKPISLPSLSSQTVNDRTCGCCEESAMKCPGSFDRRVQSARSCESLLIAGGNRIPSIDLGEGHIQVSFTVSPSPYLGEGQMQVGFTVSPSPYLGEGHMQVSCTVSPYLGEGHIQVGFTVSPVFTSLYIHTDTWVFGV